jgi:hypothetical protein
LKKSKTDNDAPRRTKLLIDNELPQLATSTTDRANKEPSLAIPNSANVEPIREQLLRDRDDPNWKKSKTATEAPMRDVPNRERVDPRRTMLLRDREDPS